MTADHSSTGPLRQAVRALVWCAFLVLAHAGLVAAGEVLPIPPGPWNGGDFLAWLPSADIARLSFTVMRLVALVTIWYLGVLTALVLLARISGLRPLALVARAIALPWARRLVHHALGAGMALTIAGGLVPVAAAAAPVPAAAPVTMQVVDGDPGPVTMQVVGDDGPVTMRVAPEPSAQSVGGAIARATVTMRAEEDAAPTPATWTIAPGDHLWHVAAHTLGTAWDREPSDAEVAGYWTTLVEHNRSRLAVPSDPDLVYPGQVFELPPPPPLPAHP